MTGRSYLLTQYPLTTDYMDRFREKIGDRPVHIVVSNISAESYFDIFKYFLSLQAETIYLPVVDETSRVLLPLLKILSLISNPSRGVVVEPDFSTREFGRLESIGGALLMFGGLIGGAITLLVDWFRLGRLLKVARTAVIDNAVKRVLYLKTNLWLGVQAGGSIAHTAGVIGGLLSRNYGVDFASAEIPVALPKSEALTILPVKPPPRYVVPREINHYLHNAIFSKKIFGLHSESYGFIYQRLSQGNFTGVILSRRWKLPLVMEYNGSEAWLAHNWGRPLTFEKLAIKAEEASLRHAHLVVTVSDVLRDELIAGGIDAERILAYPNGVDPIIFDPDRFSPDDIAMARQRFKIPADAVVATFVGTFGHWHGAEILAQTLRQLAKTDVEWLAESKLHVLFIGDGVKRPDVEKILAAPELHSFFTIAGLIAQEETPLFMAASDILLSPHIPNPDGSAFFGSPTKLFEYLSTGRPVIASDLYQIGEVLKGCPSVDDLATAAEQPDEEQCGVLVSPEDTDELSAALRFLVDNPAWRRAAGAKARRRALARYTWGHHVEAILGRLQTVLAKDAVLYPVPPSHRPIRILVNGLHSKSGGGVTYLQNMLPLLAADSAVEVHLCIHQDQRGILPKDIGNVSVHCLSFKSGFWRLAFWEQYELPRLARRIDAEVTFSPANYGPLLAPNPVILLRNALSVGFVERRPAKIAYWMGVYFGTALSLLVCRRAISVSNYALRSVGGGLLRLVGERISIIPHGVAKIFSPANSERQDFLLAVSDIYVQKNLRNLLYALVKLRAGRPGIKLKIAGRPIDKGYFDSLRKIVKRQGLHEQVEFLGQVSPDELAGLYRRCAVFVFPSSIETFGNPLVEAMASGAPIASSNSAAMPEVVGDAALFFDPADVDGMAAALDRLLKDAELRRGLGARALANSGDFSWPKTAARTLDVLKEAAQRPSPGR